eukprot:Gb_41254 [translate_table: standard]
MLKQQITENMGEYSNLDSGKNLEVHRGKKGASGTSFSVASLPKVLLRNTVAPLVSLKQVKLTKESTGQLFFFLMKVAALEVVRRVSEARCPVLWKGIQGIGLLKYPPFSWLQRWTPFRHLVKGTQEFSRPVLLLSIATAFVGHPEERKDSRDTRSNGFNNSGSVTTRQIEEVESTGTSEPVEILENRKQGHCLEFLKSELDKLGIILPDRITDDELGRFYIAASGDFLRLLSLVKKTILWRGAYYFLTQQELDNWSHLVFWHGCDIQLRPCLVIRLGLACSCLQPDERPRFAQAVVSQVEYGVLHLINVEDPRITVLMDCEGISAFGFPVQMMKSCAVLVQEHYPTRLASLFVVNLSPVLRVIAQAIIQVLKPVTREKLQIVGDHNRRILTEYLESIPSFLDGDCTCSYCSRVCVDEGEEVGITNMESVHGEYDGEDDRGSFYEHEISPDGNYNHILRVVIIGLLMVWIIVALLAGFYDPEQPLIPT